MNAAERRDSDMRNDHRRHEAQIIAHAIFSEIRHLVSGDAERELHEALLSSLHRNGVMLVRDDERQKLGLEPRDEKGWTYSERVNFERERLEALMSLSSVLVKDGGLK